LIFAFRLARARAYNIYTLLRYLVDRVYYYYCYIGTVSAVTQGYSGVI